MNTLEATVSMMKQLPENDLLKIQAFEPNRAPARCLSNFCIIIEGCPSPGQSFFVLFPCFHLTAQMRSILFSNPVFSFTLVKTT